MQGFASWPRSIHRRSKICPWRIHADFASQKNAPSHPQPTLTDASTWYQGYVLAIEDVADNGIWDFNRRRDADAPDRVTGVIGFQDYNHIVATYDGSLVCLYVDKELQACNPAVLSLKASLVRGYVGSSSTGMRHLVGTLDELAIYNKALAPDRIVAHYAAAGR